MGFSFKAPSIPNISSPISAVKDTVIDVGNSIIKEGPKLPGQIGSQLGLSPGQSDFAAFLANPMFAGQLLGPGLFQDFKQKTERGTAPELKDGRIVPGEDIENLNKLLQDERGRLRGLEEGARNRLGEATELFGGAVDKRLSALLEETGFQTGEAKQATGEAFSSRGLGRSTFVTEKLGDIGLAEAEQRGQLRSQASQLKLQGEERARSALKGVSDQRISISNRLRDLERSGLQSVQFQEEMQNIKLDFDKFLVDAQLDAGQGGGLINILAGVGGLGIFGAGLAAGKSGEGNSNEGVK